MDPRSSGTPARTVPRSAHAFEILLFAAAFGVFFVTASRSYLSLDVQTANYASWRLATAHTPFIDGSHYLDHSALRWVWVQDAPNGHTVITRAPAVVLAALPAYALFQPATMSVVPGALTAAALMAAALLLMRRALQSLLPDWRATAAALAFAFTTPVWSVAANGLWPQTITVFAIALLAWSATRERWWVMGLGGVLLLSARPHAALIVAVLALTLAWHARRPGIAVRVAIPGVIALPLMAWWTHWIYGAWNPMVLFGAGSFSQVHQSVLSVSNQAGMWIAPDRGIFVFTPVLLLLLPGLVRGWSTLPVWVRALLVAGLAYTVLGAALIGFTGGDPLYGYRYGLEFLACATPAFAVTAARARATVSRFLLPVLAVQFVVIAFGAVFEHAALAYEVAWTDNAFVHPMVVGAPVLPVLALAAVILVVLVTRRVLDRVSGGAPGPEWSARHDQLPLGPVGAGREDRRPAEVVQAAPDRLGHAEPSVGGGLL